jgi:hypothetical protein
MLPSTQRLIPDTFTAADLSAMPDFDEITPELIDHYVRQGKAMRSEMLFNAAGAGVKALRGLLSALAHRFSTVHGQVGTPR